MGDSLYPNSAMRRQQYKARTTTTPSRSSLGEAIRRRFRNSARAIARGGVEAAAAIAAGEATAGNAFAMAAATSVASAAMDITPLAYEEYGTYPSDASQVLPQKMARTFKKRSYSKRKPLRTRVPRPLVPVEIKHVDVNVNALTLGVTATWNAFSIGPFPTLGLDFSNRIGRSIFVERMQLRVSMEIVAPGAISLNGDSIMMDLYLDKENKASVGAAASDIYDLIAAPDAIISMPNASNLKRFKCVMRKKFDVSITSVNAGVVNGANIDEFTTSVIPLKKLIHYNSTNGGSAADIIDNCYNLTFCYNNTPVGGVTPYKVSYNVRFWYRDL